MLRSSSLCHGTPLDVCFLYGINSRFEVFPVGASTSLQQIMHLDVLLSFLVKYEAHGHLGDWRSNIFSVLMWSTSLSKDY